MREVKMDKLHEMMRDNNDAVIRELKKALACVSFKMCNKHRIKNRVFPGQYRENKDACSPLCEDDVECERAT